MILTSGGPLNARRISDAQTLRQTAHALQGAAANAGATPLAAVCGEYQAAAREGHAPTSDERLLGRLTNDVQRSVLALSAVRMAPA
jgi:HPt (histidine-containing phosphotransfer) domain-containing protein